MRVSKRQAWIFLAGLVLASPGLQGADAQEAGEPATSPKTAKERQAGKAYDPQRVNDCKVPPELRSNKLRSTGCSKKAKAAAKKAEKAATGGTRD